MSALRSYFVLGILVVLTSVSLVLVPGMGGSEASQSQALSALAESEAAVVSAYQAVANADGAGANVSGLLVRLNEAGELLARAHAAYGSGDFDSALELANLCQERLVGFVADADASVEVADRDHDLDFLVNVVISIVGSVGVVWFGVLVWFYLDRRYGKIEGQVR